MPDKALKSVLLPVFGLPIKATRAGRVLVERIAGEGTVTALDSVHQVATTCSSAADAVAAGSDHAAPFVTEMHAASATRIEIETLWTRN